MTKGFIPNEDIDIGLDVMCRLSEPEQTLTVTEMAHICNCSNQRINQLIASGLRKLRKVMPREDYFDD